MKKLITKAQLAEIGERLLAIPEREAFDRDVQRRIIEEVVDGYEPDNVELEVG